MLIRKNKNGFTIVELLVVIVVSSLLMAVLSNFFINSYQAYLNLHENALRSSEVSSALQRIAKVVRGSNTILEANPDSFTAYAYFTPRDTTLSKIHYFYDNASKSIMAGVTPATGSPPTYTYSPANEKTFKVIGSVNNNTIFEYLNDSWENTTFSASELKDIKGVRLTISTNQLDDNRAPIVVDTAVSLRNRKTNL